MQIQIQDDLKSHLAARAAEQGFSSIDAYVEALLRAQTQEQQVMDEDLEELLLKRLDSGPSIPLTPEFMQQFKDQIAQRRKSGNRS